MPAPRSTSMLVPAAAGLAWLGGAAVALWWPQALPLAVAQGLVAAGLGLGLVAWLAPRWVVTALIAALALLGAGSTGWRIEHRLAQQLPAALEGLDLWVTGTVASLPQPGVASLRFEFDVTGARDASGALVALPDRLAVSWFAGASGDFLPGAALPDLRPGQQWRLPLRLKRVHGRLNPGGFDLELWMFERGLHAQAQVRPLAAGMPPQWLGSGWAYPVDRLRQQLREAIGARVSDGRAAGVLAALVVGDQAAIARDDWELFRQTGVAHLMSISGLHVTMFAWLAAALLGWAWRGSRRLPLWCPAPTAARWGGVLLAAAYALLAGWGVPAQRTVWMLATLAWLSSSGRAWPMALSLLAAAVVVTLADPWALLQPGFWLSFGAVALLGMAGPVKPPSKPPGLTGRLTQAWREHLRSQWVATLGLAPLAMLFFQQVSLVGAVANLVAIPLVTLVITPLALMGMLLQPVWIWAAWGVQALAAGLQVLASVPLAVWSAAAAPAWTLLPALAGALLLVLPLPRGLRLLGLPLLLPLLWPAVPRPAPGQFEILAADVGQGSSVLVRTRGHLLVYDTGPSFGPDNDAGQRVLLPLLRWRGEQRIDLLVLSHQDSDHVGGAATLLRSMPVTALASSLPDGHPLRSMGGAAQRRCLAGQRWQWDGVAFEFLHPHPEDLIGSPRPNSLSCVLKVRDAQGRSALLTGDIEAAQEAALLQRHGAALATQWLLLPHHGSRSSSTPAFLQAVGPKLAVVQAGYRSRFGHPAPEVLQRLAAQGIPLVRSDECGAHFWRPDPARPQGECLRQQQARHWRWRPALAALPAPAQGAGTALVR